MKNLILAFGAMCFIIICTVCSCTYDNLPEPIPPEFCDTIPATYDLNVKAIVETNCAYDGCHNWAAIGDFNTYEGMRSRLESGEITDRVISQKDDPNVGMPPDYATEGPQNLTPEELDIFMCWLEAEYPEN